MNVYIIDAFTNEAFKGNPAGVCLLDYPIPDIQMQNIASELNFSETAFLIAQNDSGIDYNIRYFTPTTEIDFCGHATLACSKLILHKMNKPVVNFTTINKLKLGCTVKGEEIKMIFPLYDTIDYLPSKEFYQAFGINNSIPARIAPDLEMLIIEVESKEVLSSIQVDYAKALTISDCIKEVVITASSEDKEYDFYSRCFCPWIGINEDPVTGASHSVLAKYWSNILDKTEMIAFQISKRGGYMKLRIISETELEVVSNAKIIFEGKIILE